MAGIYIHIPFCKKLCNYCDFYHVISENDHSSFVIALKRDRITENYLSRETISTIYFGGGTPLVLSINEIDSILTDIRKHFVIEGK